MTKNQYLEIPAEVIAKIEDGECTPEQAIGARSFALVVAGFIAWASTQPTYRAMFESNDRDHFVAGLESSLPFRRDFALYLSAFTA